VVDGHGRSAHPRIYAVGDIAFAPCAPLGVRLRTQNWSHAQALGFAAGASIAGTPQACTALPWWWSDQYDTTIRVWGETTLATEHLQLEACEPTDFCVLGLRDRYLVSVAATANRTRRLVA
jgi:3-phenylpropionate/trans-cinnamate dioxygenase ferredoxin reductase subunit